MKNAGACSVCKVSWDLTEDGVLQLHHRKRLRCSGSGVAPIAGSTWTYLTPAEKRERRRAH